jgi:hypothetical protein
MSRRSYELVSAPASHQVRVLSELNGAMGGAITPTSSQVSVERS